MTIGNYPQKIANENSLGLHYSRFPTPSPCKSIAYPANNLIAAIESAKLG
jgi:hypothetical protein